MPNPEFYLRPKPVHIAFATYLKFSGLTYEQICDVLWQFHEVVTWPSTVHHWIFANEAAAADIIADVHMPSSAFIYFDEMCE